MENTVGFSPKQIVVALFSVAILLGVAHFVLFYLLLGLDIDQPTWDFMGLFDLDSEISIPTWFSQMLLLLIGVLCGLVATHFRHKKAKKLYVYQWRALAVIALFMSIDEGAAIHERMSLFIAKYTGDLSGTFFYFAWVIAGIFLVLLVVAIFFRFWWNLPPKTKWLLAAAVAVFLAGAIGVESVAGHHMSTHGIDETYRLLVLVEESLEMFGSILAIYALLDFMKTQKISLRLQVR